jgi:EcsC protein family
MDFSDVDRAALTAAIKRLEKPGFASKMTTLAGRPAELVARALPRPAASIVAKAAEAALTRALDIALFSLRDQRFIAGRVVHSALASASGAVGGALGLAALPVELPVSTAITLRMIAIAREEGEELADPRTRLACLEVFALGHTGLAAPDGAEGGYFALRVLLARGLALAADTLVRKGAAHSSSALMHRALAPIVARFTAIVSQKLALQGVAVIGAVGGAAVNLAFIEQYHGLARGHFTVRRLERVYGAEAVRAEYDQLKAAELRQPVQIADMSQGASSLIQSPLPRK